MTSPHTPSGPTAPSGEPLLPSDPADAPAGAPPSDSQAVPPTPVPSAPNPAGRASPRPPGGRLATQPPTAGGSSNSQTRPTEYAVAQPSGGNGFIVAIVLLALVIAGAGATVYFGPGIKNWWAHRQAAQEVTTLTTSATTHLDAGRFTEAEQDAQRALQLLPDHQPAKQILSSAETGRSARRQREEAAADALANADKLAAADDLAAAMDVLDALLSNPETPADIAGRAEQERSNLRKATGTLTLPDNWPGDAILSMDDQLLPTGVLTHPGIPLKMHTLTITRPGFRPPPPVTLGFTGTRPVPLPGIAWQPVGGKVSITSKPLGAAVWLNGKPTGRTTPCSFDDVTIGTVTYQLKLPGHFDTPVTGKVVSAAKLDLTASLLAQPRFPTHGLQAGDRQEFNLTPTLRVAFRWCPAGAFTMGGTDAAADDSEKPVRSVRLTQGFWLAETECTQAQWQGLTGTPFDPQLPADSPPIGLGPKFPMCLVSWDNLCGNTSRSGGLLGNINTFLRQPGGAGWIADLPTEAQWEYACRAGTTTAFGTAKPGAAEFDRSAWHAANSDRISHPVGTKEANPWGFKDLHGNVLEWCRDWYQETYKGLPSTDPTGPKHLWKLVVRGGSILSTPALCRAAARAQAEQTTASAIIGFRLVLRRPDPPPPVAKPPAKKAPAAKAPAKKAPAKKAPAKKAPAKPGAKKK